MTLKKLSKMGLTYDDVMAGEVAELDVYTLKEAKKNKLDSLVIADEFEKVIDAYSYDLLDSLQSNEELTEDLRERDQQIEGLVGENSRLNSEIQEVLQVESRIHDFEKLMDDMEGSLRQVIEARSKEVNKIKDLEAKAHEADKVKADSVSLSSEIENHKANTQALEARVAELESQLQSQTAELNDQKALVESWETSYNNDVAKLQEQLTLYEDEYTNLVDDVNTIIRNLKANMEKAGLTDFSVDL